MRTVTHDMYEQALEDKGLMDRVNKYLVKQGDHDCWNWVGATFNGDLPRIRWSGLKKGESLSVRSLMYVASGRKLTNRYVRTICGNPLCLNPNHLTCGPRAEIQEIYVPNGVAYKGGPGYKLTKEDVSLMLSMFESGLYTQGKLAEMFDVTPCNVSNIVRGRTWFL
jgi:hypothetical protein